MGTAIHTRGDQDLVSLHDTQGKGAMSTKFFEKYTHKLKTVPEDLETVETFSSEKRVFLCSSTNELGFLVARVVLFYVTASEIHSPVSCN